MIKKVFVGFVFCVMLISFVSAGLFGSDEKSISCFGKLQPDFFNKDSVTLHSVGDTDSKLTDNCKDENQLKEYYCKKRGCTYPTDCASAEEILGKELYDCPNGCKDGACVKDGNEKSDVE